MSSSGSNNDGMEVLSEAASLAHPSAEENQERGVDVAAEAYAASLVDDDYLVETVESGESDEETEVEREEESAEEESEEEESEEEEERNGHDNDYHNNNATGTLNSQFDNGERVLELDGSNKTFGTLVGKDNNDDFVILMDDARILSINVQQITEGVAEYKEFVELGRGRDTFLKCTGPMLDAFYFDQHDYFRIWSRSNMCYDYPPLGDVGKSPEDFIGMKFVYPDNSSSDDNVYSITSHMLSARKSGKNPMMSVDFVAHNRSNEQIVISYGDFLLQRREYIVKFGAPLVPREDALNRRHNEIDLDAQVESNIAAATEQAKPQSEKLRRSVRKRKPSAAAKEHQEELEQRKCPKTNTKINRDDSDATISDDDDKMVVKSLQEPQKRKTLASRENAVKARETKLKRGESMLKKKIEDLQMDREEFEREKIAFEKEKETFQRQKKQTSPDTTIANNGGTPAKERLYELNGVRRKDVWKHIKLIHPDTPLPNGQTQWENKDAVGAFCKLCETEIAGFKSTAQSNSVTAHYNKFHATSNVIAPTTPAAGVPRPLQHDVATPAPSAATAAASSNLHLLPSATPATASSVPTAQLSVHPSTTATPAPAGVPTAHFSVHPSTTVTPGYYQPPVQPHLMQQQPPMMQQPQMMQMQQQPAPYYHPPQPHGYYSPAPPPPPYYNAGYPPPPPHHYRPY